MVTGTNVNSGDGRGVYGHKLSTVVPAHVTGEDVFYELADMDLAMKLHYLRAVYYFKGGSVVEGLGITAFKAPMFPLLDLYYPVSGRIRRSEAGRPHIKCNDSGVRIIEASCSQTLDEWLEVKDPARFRYLVTDKVIGPDLLFSPSIFIQFTRFKCGGLAIGFSWAHVLGDAVSATNCINLWGQLLTGNPPPNLDHFPSLRTKKEKPVKELSNAVTPPSVKQVEPVGDHWVVPNNCTMATFSLQITETKLKQLQSKIASNCSPFEALSALLWQCLANIRVGREPKLVTICRSNASAERKTILSNDQLISTVVSECSPTKLELSELAMLIRKQAVDEKKAIEELVDGESGKPDLVFYGANLTFVDMEGVDLHGLDLKGQKPVQMDYCIDGVGDEGTILVLQIPEKMDGSDGNRQGRLVTLILPEDQMQQLKEVLQYKWGIA